MVSFMVWGLIIVLLENRSKGKENANEIIPKNIFIKDCYSVGVSFFLWILPLGLPFKNGQGGLPPISF